MKTEPKLEPWMSAFERFTGAKFVTAKAIGQDEIDEEIVKEEEDIKNMTNTEIVEEFMEFIKPIEIATRRHIVIKERSLLEIEDFLKEKLSQARAEGRAEYKREYEMIQKVTDASSGAQLARWEEAIRVDERAKNKYRLYSDVEELVVYGKTASGNTKILFQDVINLINSL